VGVGGPIGQQGTQPVGVIGGRHCATVLGGEGERGSDWVGGGRAVVVGQPKAHSVVLQLIKDFQAKSNFKRSKVGSMMLQNF
jgi:hypothetical protein